MNQKLRQCKKLTMKNYDLIENEIREKFDELNQDIKPLILESEKGFDFSYDKDV